MCTLKESKVEAKRCKENMDQATEQFHEGKISKDQYAQILADEIQVVDRLTSQQAYRRHENLLYWLDALSEDTTATVPTSKLFEPLARVKSAAENTGYETEVDTLITELHTVTAKFKALADLIQNKEEIQ